MVRKTRTVKMNDDEWANVIKFRGWLESRLGRRVSLSDAVSISAKLNLLYLKMGETTRFNFTAKGTDLEKVSYELGGEELRAFLGELNRIFGVVVNESETLKEYKEKVINEAKGGEK